MRFESERSDAAYRANKRNSSRYKRVETFQLGATQYEKSQKAPQGRSQRDEFDKSLFELAV